MRNLKYAFIVYIFYILFQLLSHASRFDDKPDNNFFARGITTAEERSRRRVFYIQSGCNRSKTRQQILNKLAYYDASRELGAEANASGSVLSMEVENKEGDTKSHVRLSTITADTERVEAEEEEAEEEEAETPIMSLTMCISLILIVTIVSPHP